MAACLSPHRLTWNPANVVVDENGHVERSGNRNTRAKVRMQDETIRHLLHSHKASAIQTIQPIIGCLLALKPQKRQWNNRCASNRRAGRERKIEATTLSDLSAEAAINAPLPLSHGT